MRIKTMAVEITENTYPIAVACLPPKFALIRKKLVLGSYLVINDLQIPNYQPDTEDDEEANNYLRARRGGMRYGHREFDGLTLVNFWSPKKMFKKDFVFLDVPETDVFAEVTRR